MIARMLSITRHELRIMGTEPGSFIQILAMPLLMVAFLMPAFGPLLRMEGHSGVSGAEQAVPGMIVMFSFFVAGSVGFTFFREHGWGTWNRLRASQARSAEVVVGKVLPMIGLSLAQQTVIFVLGLTVFGMALQGHPIGLVLVGTCLAVCLVGYGILLASVFHSTQQLNAIIGVSAMAMAGLGGAFTPLSVLPQWAQLIAPGVPSFWAMRGFRGVLLDEGGLAAVLSSCLVLLAFTAVFAAIALRRFRFDEAKHVNR